MPKSAKIPFEEFKSIFSKVPRICIEVIIRTDQGILLSLRQIEPYKGYWHLPGGGLLLGEKMADAVKRIASEETGLKVRILKQFTALEYTNLKSSKQSGYSHIVSVPFLVVPTSDKIRGSNQAKEIHFFKKIPVKTIPMHKKLILEHKLI